MFEAEVECIACHNYSDNNSIISNENRCLECHEEESYKEIYFNWRNTTIESVDKIEKWFSINRSKKLTDQQNIQIKRVKQLINLIKTDNSKSVHNPEFYQASLAECQKTVNKIDPLK